MSLILLLVNQLIHKDFHTLPSYSSIMSSYYKGQPLPKFGEWDVNDPASAEGFTAIFNIARDEKRTGGNVTVLTTDGVKSQHKNGAHKERNRRKYSIKRKWFCLA
ncbi:hypothetical protein QUC31_014129 [Theobroma cacao]